MSTTTMTTELSVNDAPQRSRKTNVVWKAVGYVAALLIVLALVESLVSATADLNIPEHERIFTSDVSALTVSTANGSVTIVRSSRAATFVTSYGSRGLTSPTDSELVKNGALSITSVCPTNFFDNNCNRSYVIHLPATATVNVHTGQGDIVVSGINSAETLHTAQGDIVVSGTPLSLVATTGQGVIDAKGLSSKSVYVNTGQGNIDMTFTTPPTAATVLSAQGDIEVTVPKGPDLYHLNVTTDQGRTVIDVPQDTESHRLIKATTLQGNIFIRYNNGATSNQYPFNS
jgi:DUF4097 and DUF4098 domain-containing protein YvlB